MTQISTTIVRYTDRNHDDRIAKIKRDLRSHVELLAVEHAMDGLPKYEDDYVGLTHSNIETTIRGALAFNQAAYQPISGMVIARNVSEKTAIALRERNAVLTSKKFKHASLKSDILGLQQHEQRSAFRFVVHAVLLLTAAADGMFAFSAFRYALFTPIQSFSVATAVSLTVGFGALYIAHFVSNAESSFWKVFRFLLGLIPFAWIFFYTGHLRANAMNHVSVMPGSAQPLVASMKVCGVDLALLSFSMFVIALLLCIWVHRSKEETDREFDYMQKKKSGEALDQEITELSAEISRIEAESANTINTALHSFEYAKSVEDDLINYAKYLQEVYKEINRRHRTDGLVPVFYARLPQFNFTRFFNPQNQSHNEPAN